MNSSFERLAVTARKTMHTSHKKSREICKMEEHLHDLVLLPNEKLNKNVWRFQAFCRKF